VNNSEKQNRSHPHPVSLICISLKCLLLICTHTKTRVHFIPLRNRAMTKITHTSYCRNISLVVPDTDRIAERLHQHLNRPFSRSFILPFNRIFVNMVLKFRNERHVSTATSSVPTITEVYCRICIN
jgi:hypothetical protein